MADLEEQLVYQRAFEAVIWSQPAIGIYGFRRGFVELGVMDNDVLAWSKPAESRHELLTANNNTPYIGATMNLKNGPVVLEIPAATDRGVLYGQVVDAWQETIATVGPGGNDQGKGGKYLFLPPGHEGSVPDGYIVVRSPNYRLTLAFRSIRLPGMNDEDAHRYAKTLRIYPLAEAANPQPTRFLDTWAQPLRTLPPYDLRYFEQLHEALDGEPVRPRDKAMMGMLTTLGIEAGKPFSPPEKYRAAMERGIVDAYFYMQQQFFTVQSRNLFYPDRHWSFYLLSDRNESTTFELPEALLYTERAALFHPGTFYPPKVPRLENIDAWAKAGRLPETAYLVAIADSQGRPLEAGKTYRLRVPADMPVRQFWSLIIYNTDTWAFNFNVDRVGLSSYDKNRMKMNRDGSVDIYFGPRAPRGLEQNWITTNGTRPLPMLRIYGGDERFWQRRFTMPDVELVE